MPMVGKKTVKVGEHIRRIKGRPIKVGAHRRSKRKKGKKTVRRKVGEFIVLHDELGNIKGSKIIKTNQPKKETQTKRKRSRYKTTRQVDRDYFDSKIGYNTWVEERRNLTRI